MKWPKKGSKLFSILKYKCPHCQEGEFFKSRNPYNLNVLSSTYDNCPKCGRKLYLEPGFYYGAMYVSYALGVAHCVSFWLAKTILNLEFEFWNFIILVGATLLAMSPLYYGLSKIIWANMFISFKEENNGEPRS